MLYKPKNMYPRLGSDQPIIYLDQIPENGTVDFTFNIDGNEKIQNIQGILYYKSLTGVSKINNFKVAVEDLRKYGIGPEVNTSVVSTPSYPETPFVLNAVYDYASYSEPNKKLTYNGRAKLGETIDRTGFSWQGNTIVQYFMAGNYVQTNGSFSVYNESNTPLTGDIDVDLYLTKFLGLQLSETQKQLLKFGQWGLKVNEDHDIVSRSVDTFKAYCSMQITNNKQIDMDVSSSKVKILINKYSIGQPLCKFTTTLSNLSLGHMKYGKSKYDYFQDDNTSEKQYIPVTINCSINKIDKTDIGTEVTCKCSVESIGLEKIDFSLKDFDPMIICDNISTMTFIINKDNDLVSISIAPHELSINAFLRLSGAMGDGRSNGQITWNGIQNQDSNIILSSWYLYPTKDEIFVTNLPYKNLDIYLKDNLPIKYEILKKDLPQDEQGNFSINSQSICQYNYRINNLYFSGEQFKIQTSGVPQINISIDQVLYKINAFGTFDSTSLQEKIKNYQWKLYQGIYDEDTNRINGQLIYQTDKIYSQDFQFEYDNLISGKYVIEAIVEDNYGQIWSKRKPFNVNYKQNDLYLNLQSELDKENTGVKLKWNKPVYGEINFGLSGVDDNNFSIENGILIENGPGDKDISNLNSYASIYGINFLEPLKNYISIKGSFNKWLPSKNWISFIEDYQEIYPLGRINRMSIYLCIKNNKNYLVLHDLLSAITLDPIEIEKNLGKEDFLQGIEIDIRNKNILIQYNNKIIDINASNFPNFFEKVSGGLSLENINTLDYIVTSNDSMFNKDTNAWKNDDNLKWNPNDYSCLLTFSGDKPYSYLDPNANAQFIGYNMKRCNPLTQKVLDMGQYYFTQPKEKLKFYFDNITLNTSNCIVGKIYSHPITEDLYLWNGNSLIPYTERRFVDYSLPHNEEVKYLIYPQGNEIITDEKDNETSQELIFSPIYSDSIKGDWDKWCLFTTRGPAPKNLDGTADNGYNENVLLVDKIFFFEMNVETGNMKNNTDFSVIKNFTPYPHIQRSPSNYWSGQLKGLLGRLAIDDCTFKQTPTMLQEIKELTQNTSRKFLKDRDGNFWEVELSSDITIDNNDKLDVQLKTKSFNWVEVSDASDIALVSVGPGREDWLLTELGQEQIDISRYTWDDNAIWDDNDFWTESE